MKHIDLKTPCNFVSCRYYARDDCTKYRGYEK